MQYTQNVTVFRSGYRYNQKTQQGELLLLLENGTNDYEIKIKDGTNLNDLFAVFALQERDILWINSLKRKVCRVILEENEPIALKHIINDDIVWKIR